MEVGDRAWAKKMIGEFIGSFGGSHLGSEVSPYVGATVIKYIKDNSVLNEGRESLDKQGHIPLDFQGFFFSERDTKYFGFINSDRPSQSFYLCFFNDFEDRNLFVLQQNIKDMKVHDWGRNLSGAKYGWSVTNFWDITDLVMRGISIKKGLFINWPLDPPRIGDDV